MHTRFPPQCHPARHRTGLLGPSRHRLGQRQTDKTPRLHIWSVFVVQLSGSLRLPRTPRRWPALPLPSHSSLGAGGGGKRGGGRRGRAERREGRARQSAGPPNLTPAQECVTRAARSGASSSSRASGGSVCAGLPLCQTPPSRHRLRSGSEAGGGKGHGLSHRQPCLLPLPSLGPGTRVPTPVGGLWSHDSLGEGDGETPLQSETTPDSTYSQCIHGY